MIWHYPTLKDDRWHPSKDNAWPVGGAYHILQMKETPNNGMYITMMILSLLITIICQNVGKQRVVWIIFSGKM